MHRQQLNSQFFCEMTLNPHDHQLGASIILTGRLLINSLNGYLVATGINITMEQLEILFQINKHLNKRIIQNEIATATFKNKSAIVRSIDILEKKKYVRRLAVPGDRRKNTIEITPEGNDIVNKATQVIESLKFKLTGKLNEKDIQTCQKVLDTVMSNCNTIK